ncbi:MAG: hydroxymethylglutaryl-CoA lyase [Pseudohongiellaceae bacterium]
MTPNIPETARIVEVGPRDGLQNEAVIVPLAVKIELIERLADCGLRTIETGSFVAPERVPQMADSDQVFQKLARNPDVGYTALTPNIKGFERAIRARVSEVAVFAAASETFSQRNTNCSIAESIERFEDIFNAAAKHDIPVRGYISCIIACPYEGEIAADRVVRLMQRLLELGCYQVSLGDTIGAGTPLQIKRLLSNCLQSADPQQLAVHFHNTYGQALPNILTALELGISNIDSSVAGLGGCPYAPGASGNAATEDLVYMLDGMGIATGVNLAKLIETSHWICAKLQRRNQSQAALAFRSAGRTNATP